MTIGGTIAILVLPRKFSVQNRTARLITLLHLQMFLLRLQIKKILKETFQHQVIWKAKGLSFLQTLLSAQENNSFQFHSKICILRTHQTCTFRFQKHLESRLLISNKITEVVESNKIQIVRMKTIYYLHNQILTWKLQHLQGQTSTNWSLFRASTGLEVHYRLKTVMTHKPSNFSTKGLPCSCLRRISIFNMNFRTDLKMVWELWKNPQLCHSQLELASRSPNL